MNEEIGNRVISIKHYDMLYPRIFPFLYHSDLMWASWRSILTTTQQFVQHIVQDNMRENIKAPHYRHFVREIYWWRKGCHHKRAVYWAMITPWHGNKFCIIMQNLFPCHGVIMAQSLGADFLRIRCQIIPFWYWVTFNFWTLMSVTGGRWLGPRWFG